MRALLGASLGVLLTLAGCSQSASPSVMVKEVCYHRAPDFKGDSIDLYASIEIPADTNRKRPLLILVHGGGFESGTRNQSFLRRMAREFAEHGYVTARISYRLGLPQNWGAWDWLAANIRAVQDLRTFIRYMKYQAAHGNPYGIDTTRIIALGWSAGGFTVLQAAFLTTPEELALLPEADTVQLRRMGGLYGEAYSAHTSDFWAVVSLSGAVYRTEWIAPEKVTHLIIFHPLHDKVIRYGQQVAGRGITWYGGGIVYQTARQKNMSAVCITTYYKGLGFDPHYSIGEEGFMSIAYPAFTQIFRYILEKFINLEKFSDEESYIVLDFSLTEIIPYAVREAICRITNPNKHDCILGYIRYIIEYLRGNVSVDPPLTESLSSIPVAYEQDKTQSNK